MSDAFTNGVVGEFWADQEIKTFEIDNNEVNNAAVIPNCGDGERVFMLPSNTKNLILDDNQVTKPENTEAYCNDPYGSNRWDKWNTQEALYHNYKNKLCTFWIYDELQCRYGAFCGYAHGAKEQNCKYWMNKNTVCYNGYSCKYAHRPIFHNSWGA